jgi:PKD domain/K319L-like, PKD domain/RTX calcium-binding nonapeptide repeat (4 copies)
VVTITNCTISGNSAGSDGGGIFNRIDGSVDISNSTLNGNRADANGSGTGVGGGLFNAADAPPVVLHHTIVAGNLHGTGTVPNEIGGIASGGSSFNLIGDAGTSGGLTNGPNGNIVATIPIATILDTNLVDNGGPTLTHALVPGSPALDAGDPAFDPQSLPYDQRGVGFARVFGGRIDIGAFELQNSPPTADAGGPYVVNEGTSLVLDASSSSDPDVPNSALAFEWDLDYDGITFNVDATGQAPTVSFPDNFAARTIALRVTDSDGESDIATTTLTVNNVAPTIAMTGVPTTAVEGDTIGLGSTVTDPGTLDAHTIDWSLTKDGTAYDAGSGATFDFTPDDNGTYEVTLTVTDDDGGVGTTTETIEVGNVAPTIANLAVTSSIDENGTATLTGNIVDPGTQDSFTLSVDWGEGSPVETFNYAAGTTSFSETHSYLDDGPGPGGGVGTHQYTISVTATDNDGGRWAASDGDEFAVNAPTRYSQERPDIVGLADGGFVVVWYGSRDLAYGDGNLDGVFGQRYNVAAEPVGSSFQANTYTEGYQTLGAVGALADGGFVVAWQSRPHPSISEQEPQDGSGVGVFAQRFDADGNRLGGEFGVNTTTDGDQGRPKVVGLSGGGFVITWTGIDEDASGVFGQQYDPNGAAVGGEFRVNSTTAGDQQKQGVSPVADGGFVVVWDDAGTGEIRGQRYTASGAAVGGEFTATTSRISPFQAAVAGMADGGFVVGWAALTDGSSYGVYSQRFDASGTPIGAVIPINTYTDNRQWEIRLAADANGGFVAVWDSIDQDGDKWGVFARKFDSQGQPLSDEVQVNQHTLDTQFQEVVTGLADGTFAVAWNSWGQASESGYNIYARKLGDATFSGNASLELVVSNVDPTPTITGAAATADEGDTIHLESSISDPGTLDTRTLAWGVTKDGSAYDSGSGTTFDFTPDDNGTYEVTLTVTDDDGGVGTDTVVMTVNNVTPVLAPLTLSSTTIDENGTVTVDGSFTDPGSTDTHQVVIDWGDGTANTVVTLTNSDRTFAASHQYLDDGNYDIRAEVTDDDQSIFQYETATLGETGQSSGLAVRNDSFLGTRFEVTAPVDIAEIGGHLTVFSGSLFGAVIALTGPDDLPDSTNLSTPDVLDTVLISGTNPSADVKAPLSLHLEPGWYALMFGSGLFGANGYGAAAYNNTDIGSPSYFTRGSDGQFYTDNLQNVRFVIQSELPPSVSESVIVNNVAPTLNPLTLSSTEFDENGTLTLNGSFTDPGNADTHEVVIEWGDGSQNTVLNLTSGERTISAAHQYVDDPTGTPADQYTITAMVTDDDQTVFQYETATLGETGVGVGVGASTTQYVGARFEVAASVSIAEIGAHLTASGSIFGALIALSGPTDFPDSTDLSTSDVIGSVLIPPTYPSAEVTAPLALHLEPGWYAVMFGSGLFGADGIGSVTINNTDIGSPSYLRQTSGAYYDGGFQNARFFVRSELPSSASATVTVNNVAPTANAGPDLTVNEGDAVVLDGMFADPGSADTHTFLWQVTALNGQVVPNGIGEDFRFIPNNDGPYIIDYTVTDDDGGTSTDQVVIAVENVAPTLSISGDTNAVRGFRASVTLNATDASPIDQAALFQYAIDWEGDGAIDDVISGTDSKVVTHVFPETGKYSVTVTATDVDGAVGPVATRTVDVVAAAKEQINSETFVKVGTSPQSGKAILSFGSVDVTFLDLDDNVLEQLTFDDQDVDGIIVQGQDADDEIIIDLAITLPVEVFAGAGNDTIQGGGGTNILHGEDGSDTLIGGTGSNTLDGGDGDDVLQDGGGANTIIGGTGSNTFVDGGGTNTFETEEAAATDDADPPQLIVTPQASGNEGAAIPLAIWAGLSDTDGSESLSVEITGVPDFATLSAGQKSADGSWTIATANPSIDLTGITLTPQDNGDFTLAVTTTATENANGTMSSLAASIAVTVNNVAPHNVVTDAAIGEYVFAVGETKTFAGSFADVGSADTHDTAGTIWTFSHAVGISTVTETRDATVNEAADTVSDDFSFTEAGVYSVTLIVTDDDGGATTSISRTFVVYDPSEGFVTGGGWIDSPAGAYVPDPTLTGKATFGFVSKYKKGQTTPTGNTTFEFKVADLEFNSSRYEWLVVAGARAQYKGEGAINGAGNYGFMLTVIDGQVSGGGGVDKFRMKIWDKDNGDAVVYDNALGVSDDNAPPSPLGGGSVIIHDNGNALHAAADPTGAGEISALSHDVLDPVVDQAIAYWSAAGVDDRDIAALSNVDVQLADLSGSLLGMASESNIAWIDVDAAGVGWGGDGYDLLSAVSHELGHMLGFDHDCGDVMDEFLSTNLRTSPVGRFEEPSGHRGAYAVLDRYSPPNGHAADEFEANAPAENVGLWLSALSVPDTWQGTIIDDDHDEPTAHSLDETSKATLRWEEEHDDADRVFAAFEGSLADELLTV